MTRIGMNMLLWTDFVTMEHVPIFEKLKAAGFAGVEIPIGKGDAKHYAELRRSLDDLELECTTVAALGADTNPVSPDTKVRTAALEKMKWTIDMSTVLESKILVGPFHSAFKEFTGKGPTADEMGWCAEVMRGAAEHGATTGVDLSVEFLNRFECYVLNTAGDAAKLVKAVDHPSFGMLYDTHHANIEEKDVDAAIRGANKAINHIHISENDRGTPGKGQVRWEETFAALEAIDYDGWLVIEAFSRLNPDFAAAIHIWRDFFPTPDEVYLEGIRFIERMTGG